MPASTNGGHHSIIVRRRRLRGAHQSHHAASGTTANVAAALTPPTTATASALSAAWRLGSPRTRPTTSGTSTHGASADGHISMDEAPRTVSMRGDRANAKPARMRVQRLPMPNTPSSTTVPRNATTSSRDHHSRWVTQGDMLTRSPKAKNGPIGNR